MIWRTQLRAEIDGDDSDALSYVRELVPIALGAGGRLSRRSWPTRLVTRGEAESWRRRVGPRYRSKPAQPAGTRLVTTQMSRLRDSSSAAAGDHDLAAMHSGSRSRTLGASAIRTSSRRCSRTTARGSSRAGAWTRRSRCWGGARALRADGRGGKDRRARSRPHARRGRAVSDLVACGACGTENRAGRKFCAECGAALGAVACASCGAANAPGRSSAASAGRRCAAQLQPHGPRPPLRRRPSAGSSRVLFADLVGYTALSEGRDVEDVRELQSRYFDTARTVIERYGGTVEKFIGDAVMALWGAPVAHEDDAERAVRAALDLVDAVAGARGGRRRRAPGCAPACSPGEAAVTLGAEGQGMVTGDLVNTASRIQAAAEPGTVLVGEATRRATEAAIAYADAGEHELKGKTEPFRSGSALRVVAQRRRRRAVGRPRGAVRRTRAASYASSRSSSTRAPTSAAHVSSRSSASPGSASRDCRGSSRSTSTGSQPTSGGIAAAVSPTATASRSGRSPRWCAGRAEDPRGRGRRDLHGEAPSGRRDPRPRRGGARLDRAPPPAPPRVSVSGRATDREDLFSAWRRFFERLAEQGPLVLVFEDLHWADEGLVAFVEYLLDWGRASSDLRPHAWRDPRSQTVTRASRGRPGTQRRCRSSRCRTRRWTSSSPVSCPGLPDDVRVRLRDAADGVPLYAVETVRMLRDRGLLERGRRRSGRGGRSHGARGAGDAACADRLPARRPCRTASDGCSRTRPSSARRSPMRGLAALSGLDEREVDSLVSSLVRKELLAVETDPFSPERGQLGFLQALVQRVTYETIARKDRRAAPSCGGPVSRHRRRHRPGRDRRGDRLALSRRPRSRSRRSRPGRGARTGAQLVHPRRRARRVARRVARGAARVRAGRRPGGGGRRARPFACTCGRARRRGRTGRRSRPAARRGDCDPRPPPASAPSSSACRVAARRGVLHHGTDRGRGRAPGARRSPRTRRRATRRRSRRSSAQLAVCCSSRGAGTRRTRTSSRALGLAEHLRLPEVIVEALNTKALMLRHRPNESLGLMRQALVLAEETGADRGALRACMNLSYLLAIAGAGHGGRGGGRARARPGAEARRQALGTRACEQPCRLVLHDRPLGRDGARRRRAPARGAASQADPVQAATYLALAEIALYRGETDRVLRAGGRVRHLGGHREHPGTWRRNLGACADRPGRRTARRRHSPSAWSALGDESITSNPVSVGALPRAADASRRSPPPRRTRWRS